MAGTTVFDMTDFTVTTCAAENYTKDFEIPIMKGWRKGNINRPRFLHGIKAGFDDQEHDAYDQTIIMKGSQVTVIEGSQYQKVNMDRSTYIVKKEELKVDDARKVEIKKDDRLEVKGNYNLDVKEDAEMLFRGMLERSIIGPFIHTNLGAKLVNEVSEWVDWKGKQTLSLGFASVSINFLSKADIFGMAIDAGLVYRDFILLGNEICLFGVRHHWGELKQKILGLDTVALSAKQGGPYIHGCGRIHL
jgi:hypothetical protein